MKKPVVDAVKPLAGRYRDQDAAAFCQQWPQGDKRLRILLDVFQYIEHADQIEAAFFLEWNFMGQ